jgi:hypothetical protein
MITDAILQIFIGLLNGLISILPTGGVFPSQVTTAVANISQVVHMFDDIIPMASMMSAILFLITVNLAIFAFVSARFIIGIIRGN